MMIIDPYRYASAGGGGGTWTPAVGGLGSSLSLWFDPSDNTSYTIATGVSQLNDKSGLNLHITQATGANQPTITSAAQNGRDALTFNGTSQRLAKTSGLSSHVPNNNSQTTFFVALPTSVTAGHLYWTTNGSTVAGVIDVGTASAKFQGNSNNFATDSETLSAWHLYSGYIALSNRQLYLDGTSKAQNTTTETAATRPTQIWFGSDSNPTSFFKGSWGEFIQYDGTLSAADRQKVEGYLAWKWGLQGNLPAGHPYKSAAP